MLRTGLRGLAGRGLKGLFRSRKVESLGFRVYRV